MVMCPTTEKESKNNPLIFLYTTQTFHRQAMDSVTDSYVQKENSIPTTTNRAYKMLNVDRQDSPVYEVSG